MWKAHTQPAKGSTQAVGNSCTCLVVTLPRSPHSKDKRAHAIVHECLTTDPVVWTSAMYTDGRLFEGRVHLQLQWWRPSDQLQLALCFG